MNALVIGGFLGSGKTTLLLQLAEYLNAGATDHPNLVIIENEIGDEGIDDKLIRANGYLVEVMTAGCVCCLMLGNLIMTIEAIQKRLDPQWLIIEATGVADTTTIVRTIERRIPNVGGVSGIVVVDAQRYDLIMNNIPGFVKGQIMHADCIFLNKMDLLDPAQQSAMIDKVSSLKNEYARIYPVCAARPIDTAVWEEVIQQNEEIGRSYALRDG